MQNNGTAELDKDPFKKSNRLFFHCVSCVDLCQVPSLLHHVSVQSSPLERQLIFKGGGGLQDSTHHTFTFFPSFILEVRYNLDG